ncbi:transcription factor CRF1-domain-containing protein [Scheffersomyces coipomensis]|uniref:transcription factor CRF1-domain-containing protein n=1 Tax=Scheffersomyces coipomensis TaxID=1788519 RepID=UPI00315C8FDB
MAKSPKVPYHKNSKAVSNGLNSKHSTSVGGKNFKSYKNQYYKNGHNNSIKNRRFSIAESSSSDSDKIYDNATVYEVESISDSESSLTAVSDDGNNTTSKQNQFTSAKYNKKTKSGIKGVSNKKKSSKKSINWDWNQNINDNSDDSEDDDDDDDDEEDLFSSSDDESDVDFIKLQAQKKVKSLQAARAMKALKAKQIPVTTTNVDDGSDIDSELESESEVDISDITALAQQKPTTKKQQINDNHNNNNNNNNNKAKFGRRRSDAVIPDGINFTFEFDDFEKKDNSDNENDEDHDIDDDNDDEDMESTTTSNVDEKFEIQEEDIGEEIDIDTEGNIPNNADVIDKVTDFNFDFDNQLIQVPKIKESELSSDDDYEIDDNELLATLQADNDLEEFTNSGVEKQTKFRRSSSADSVGDDEENDPFLKEEEKFLVNEFETNGFDEEEEEIGIEDYNFSDSSNRKTLINSFKAIDTHGDSTHVLQYESSIDSGSESEVEDDDEDDGYEDLIDFNAPFFTHNKPQHNNNNNNHHTDDASIKSQTNSEVSDIKDKKDKHKHKHKHKTKPSAMNSDEDDDTYLWNYFFSSDDGGSSDEEDNDGYVEDDDDKIADEISKSMDTKTSNRRMTLTAALNNNRRKSVAPNLEFSDRSNIDDGYESGESTDEDLNLPTSTNKTKVGSQKAKEVLSSKTADYRPPILGTWVALDSKPFGIIDGLSTRILQTGSINKAFEIKSKARRSIVAAHNDVSDDAMGLDELLNVSELDNDDENDIKIWRDFNSQKKKVPLGAFRNKSILQNALVHPENVTSHYQTSKSSYTNNNKHRKPSVPKVSSHVNKPSSSSRKSSVVAVSVAAIPASAIPASSSLSTKQKRRRASIVEAVSEGFRSTKSGLFNETALSNVEEMLGDDNDLMALIKGL